MSTLQPLEVEPEKAGLARLQFGSTPGLRATDVGRPENEPDLILFGARFADIEYYPLLDGSQFLARVPHWMSHTLYFGGTDEAPFLVELEAGLFTSLKMNGEDRFYEMLKPKLIRALEKAYGSEGTVRQGDIWAYQFPGGYAGLRQDPQVEYNGSLLLMAHDNRTVMGTRHRLDGWLVQTKLTLRLGGKQMFVPKSRVAEGVLSAPDHADVVLEGPHILSRTEGIQPTLVRWDRTADGQLIRIQVGD